LAETKSGIKKEISKKKFNYSKNKIKREA